jgi:hypothetical protein
MSIWLKRRCTTSEWSPVQRVVGELQISLGGPPDVMMISSDQRWSDEKREFEDDIYIQVPTRELTDLFPGFVAVSADDLPKVATGLVTRVDAFERLFSYPTDRR